MLNPRVFFEKFDDHSWKFVNWSELLSLRSFIISFFARALGNYVILKPKAFFAIFMTEMKIILLLKIKWKKLFWIQIHFFYNFLCAQWKVCSMGKKTSPASPVRNHFFPLPSVIPLFSLIMRLCCIFNYEYNYIFFVNCKKAWYWLLIRKVLM